MAVAGLGLKGNKHEEAKKLSHSFLLLIEVVFTLFIAGIVVPSLLRSDLPYERGFSLWILPVQSTSRGLRFSYTTHNVEFAILGALIGRDGSICYPFFPPVHSRTQRPHNQSLCRLLPCHTENRPESSRARTPRLRTLLKAPLKLRA